MSSETISLKIIIVVIFLICCIHSLTHHYKEQDMRVLLASLLRIVDVSVHLCKRWSLKKCVCCCDVQTVDNQVFSVCMT